MKYVTVFDPAEAQITEKRSVFIGRIAHASDESEAVEFVNKIKSLERDARHNVFAYITSQGKSVRCSDDGEPQGTGGLPCLEVLKNSGITDVVVVVTRYFGGILLGAPGLVRAYTKAAADAVASAKQVTMTGCKKVTSCYDYSFHGKISLLTESSGQLDLIDYSDRVKLSCYIPEENVGKYIDSITEICSGSAECTVSEQVFFRAM